MNDDDASHAPPKRAADRPSPIPRKVQSDALLGDAKELLIVHNGREYRLRLTHNSKLILTA
jgi:hemin uptake protein HemP